jgi:hypothetical protein
MQQNSPVTQHKCKTSIIKISPTPIKGRDNNKKENHEKRIKAQ